MPFSRYIALGDSMSIDLYPALDAGETDVAVALQWDRNAGAVARLGAASLLHHNDDVRYPDFSGNDLLSREPNIAYTNLAEDGATIGDVFGSQVPEMREDNERTLVTLTVGGNDLLSAYANTPVPELLTRFVRDIGDAYAYLVDGLRRAMPDAVLVLGTVYDPSDGTRHIPGVLGDAGPLPLESLHAFNDRIRRVAGESGALVADVHAHFLGHGVTAPEADRWYWRRSLVEPNAAGASEIRRVWLDALDGLMED